MNMEDVSIIYKRETGDYLVEDIDKYQRFVEQYLEDYLQEVCDIRFEAKPTLLNNVLSMHKAMDTENDERLFQIRPHSLEIKTVSPDNASLLRTVIPEKSFLVYNVGNSIEANGGEIGLDIHHIIEFCKIGDKEDIFRYRYDSKLSDFYIQHKNLRRKFGGIRPESMLHVNVPNGLSNHSEGIVNLHKIYKDVFERAKKLYFNEITLSMKDCHLCFYASKQIEQETAGIDELDDMIEIEEWNGMESKAVYSATRLEPVILMLKKRYKEAMIRFSNNEPLHISCGNILGNEDDDEYKTDFFLAPIISEKEEEMED